MQPSSVADDDEEDLEQLRLAALKSLKKPLVACSDKVPMQKPYFKNGVNRGRSNFHGRMHRNVSHFDFSNVFVCVCVDVYVKICVILTRKITVCGWYMMDFDFN